MDDYNISSLTESRNEWTARLVTILCPFIIEGFKSIYEDAYKLCIENNEDEKYLMTFQNLLSRIPKWNKELVENEVSRIKENSKCGYIEDLITCVHIIQLKALTCIRVGQNQKKVDIDIPNLADFIHKIYISVARKLYTNIYLFQKNINPLEMQKHNREIELIIKECILNSVRDTIPIETILRSYLDEVTEETMEVEEELIPAEDDMVSVDGSEENMESKSNEESLESKTNPNLLIEEVMNDNESSIKLKDTDNIVISDDNYGVMLDIKELNAENTENTKKSGESEEPKEPVLVTEVPDLNDAEKQGVSFSNDLDISEIESTSNDDDEKLKIEDVNLDLGDVISIDSIDESSKEVNDEPSLLGDIETLT